jgi:hypothetical protein
VGSGVGRLLLWEIGGMGLCIRGLLEKVHDAVAGGVREAVVARVKGAIDSMFVGEDLKCP